MADVLKELHGFGLAGLSAVLCLLAVLWTFGARPASRLSAAELATAVALGVVIGVAALSPPHIGIEAAAAVFGLTFLLCGSCLVDQRRAKSFTGSAATLVYHEGSFLPGSLAEAGTRQQNVVEAVRAHGYKSLQHISSVAAEADGTFTIIPHPNPHPRPVLRVISNDTQIDG